MDPLVRASLSLQRVAERHAHALLFAAALGLLSFAGSLVPSNFGVGFEGLVYATLAVASALLRPSELVAIVVLSLALVGLRALGEPGEPALVPLGLRLALCFVFGFLYRALYQKKLQKMGEAARSELNAEKKRLLEAARAYRLTGSVESSERGLETGALELAQSVDFVLTLLAASFELNGVAYYSADTRGRLTLRAACPQKNFKPRIESEEGPLAVAAARRESFALVGNKVASRAAPYLEAEPVGALYCLPAQRGASLEGLLYVDRRAETPFDDEALAVFSRAVEFILRAAENERAFSRLERQAREQSKLYRAAEALGAARSEAEVIELGVEAARDVAAFDFAAVTLFHRKNGLHEICAVSGGSLEHLVGSTFRQNAGLVSMVIANQHPLPYRGEYDSERQLVFSRGQEVRGLPSLLVLPLLLHERALGTLVLGSEQKGVFSEEVRPTLEVLARHMAVSLANARMVSRLEEQATTDGLTGLLNKRALIRAAERRIRAASRFGKPLSILVTDIDHFKKVNDTYGHDVGDVVIKGLSEVIHRAQRDTDIAGRFGGEEFVVVCEQTDEPGAMNLAERIRHELEATTFQTELGPLKVTCSVGVATFPASGKDWEALFKATDEALYASKRAGRNRVTVFRPRLKVGSAAPIAESGS
jgi:two-component system, cell cycle response regulator